MSISSIESIQSDRDQLQRMLLDLGEISLANSADDIYRKSLLLAVASYFEEALTRAVLDFVRKETSAEHVVVFLVESKAVTRQYHSWFSWDGRNANAFFRLFGEKFKSAASLEVKESDALSESIEAFLKLGNDRNRLVHLNFGSFVLESTAEEIFNGYRKAKLFVEWVPQMLAKYASANGESHA